MTSCDGSEGHRQIQNMYCNPQFSLSYLCKVQLLLPAASPRDVCLLPPDFFLFSNSIQNALCSKATAVHCVDASLENHHAPPVRPRVLLRRCRNFRMVASLSNQLTLSTQPNGPASREGAESGAPASQGGVDTALAVQAVRLDINRYLLCCTPFLFLSVDAMSSLFPCGTRWSVELEGREAAGGRRCCFFFILG